jgi:hypothetical protein
MNCSVGTALTSDVMWCSLAEELVAAAQAVESGKALERKLNGLQLEYSKVLIPGI